MEVYPRVCGGTAPDRITVDPWLGLSPRVRGNRILCCPNNLVVGSIPACAGEPYAQSQIERLYRVYPRVCGGTSTVPCKYHPAGGLSPRVRGNPAFDLIPPERVGSIPACAGEPYHSQDNGIRERVYPRVCGGTCERGRHAARHRGLSPRVRGNRGPIRHALRHGGSIPACAGEPCQAPAFPSAGRVYPRVCGGTMGEWAAAREDAGLSPRVRGNR